MPIKRATLDLFIDILVDWKWCIAFPKGLDNVPATIMLIGEPGEVREQIRAAGLDYEIVESVPEPKPKKRKRNNTDPSLQ